MREFLAASAVIDHDHPDIVALARELRDVDATATARRSFERVRDQIAHSGDARAGLTTCVASDVLRARTGWCYAKAHLLVALLRANGIPAGLCYQRLSLDGEGAPFSLHGLAGAYLPGHGWYRVDPRGNKPGVDAQFQPPVERLAFAPTLPEEWDDRTVHAGPLPDVVAALRASSGWEDARRKLPDRPRPPVPSPG